jgi:hypothetical protein
MPDDGGLRPNNIVRRTNKSENSCIDELNILYVYKTFIYFLKIRKLGVDPITF